MIRPPIDDEKRRRWRDPCYVDRLNCVWYRVGEIDVDVSYEDETDADYLVIVVRQIEIGTHVREDRKLSDIVAVLQHIVWQSTGEMVGSMRRPYPEEFWTIRAELVQSFRSYEYTRNKPRLSLAFAMVFGSEALEDGDRYLFTDEGMFHWDECTSPPDGPAGEDAFIPVSLPEEPPS